MNDSDKLDHPLDAVARGESPVEHISGLNKNEARMVQMAQLISGAKAANGPSPEFAGRLRSKLVQPTPIGVPRRAALLSGLGAMAAGVAAGIGLDHVLTEPGPTGSEKTATPPLVGTNGHWAHVAYESELAEGAVKNFTAGAVTGFLMRQNGEVKAISGVCTHMACLLRFEPTQAGLVCPCHGAEFELSGKMRSYPGAWGTKLPPLPRLRVRIKNASIQVWTA